MSYLTQPPANPGTNPTALPPAPPAASETKIGASRGLAAWLTKNDTSLAVSSYQSGRLLLVGTMPDGTVSVHQETFSRAMGVCWDRGGLWLASKVQIWRLENILPEGEIQDGRFDLKLMPRRTYITGEIDVHELSVDSEGRPIFVCTAHSCLATLDEVESFRPIWKPSFISELVPEDRCHMNGLGMLNGKPRYVTAVSQTDVASGWHGRPLPKGVIIDIDDDRVVTDQLSMPHSPREDADGKLFALDSGRGFLVEVDKETGDLRDIAFCPGFLRGLSLINGYAIVTVSKPRYGKFDDLPIGDEMVKRNFEPICAVMIVDIAKGEIVEWLRLEGDIQELFSVELIPGVKCPMVVGPHTEEFAGIVSFTDIAPLVD